MNGQLRILILLSFAIILFPGCDEQSYHPQLEISLVQSGLLKQLLVVTGKAIEGNTYRVLNDACTLSVLFIRTHSRDSVPLTVIIHNIAPVNDGGFHGIWTIPDSLLIADTVKVYGCISDVTDERSCVEQIDALR